MSDPIVPDLVQVVPPVPDYEYKPEDEPVAVGPGEAGTVVYTATEPVDVSLVTLSSGAPLEGTLQFTQAGGNPERVAILFTDEDAPNVSYPYKKRLAAGDKVGFAVVGRQPAGVADANVYLTVEVRPVA